MQKWVSLDNPIYQNNMTLGNLINCDFKSINLTKFHILHSRYESDVSYVGLKPNKRFPSKSSKFKTRIIIDERENRLNPAVTYYDWKISPGWLRTQTSTRMNINDEIRCLYYFSDVDDCLHHTCANIVPFSEWDEFHGLEMLTSVCSFSFVSNSLMERWVIIRRNQWELWKNALLGTCLTGTSVNWMNNVKLTYRRYAYAICRSLDYPTNS